MVCIRQLFYLTGKDRLFISRPFLLPSRFLEKRLTVRRIVHIITFNSADTLPMRRAVLGFLLSDGRTLSRKTAGKRRPLPGKGNVAEETETEGICR